VKPPAPGKYGEYIEGWRTIDIANAIFGFDGWTRETVLLQETNRELVTLKDKQGVEYKQWRVGYLAKVRVEAGGIVREGTGFGQGQGKPEGVGDAIESAAKEAETDAMKRALMTFGNPLGLALYDKTKANVAEVAVPMSKEAETLIDKILACETMLQLKGWKRDHGEEALANRDSDAITATYNSRHAEIKQMDRSVA
jgi:DNA repair and recombination protein RAD52